MKMTESGKIVLVSLIIDFKEVQLWLRVFSLNLNTYGVMMGFLIFSGQILKRILKRYNQSCTSLKIDNAAY
jgi:hypothetical protein